MYGALGDYNGNDPGKVVVNTPQGYSTMPTGVWLGEQETHGRAEAQSWGDDGDVVAVLALLGFMALLAVTFPLRWVVRLLPVWAQVTVWVALGAGLVTLGVVTGHLFNYSYSNN